MPLRHVIELFKHLCVQYRRQPELSHNTTISYQSIWTKPNTTWGLSYGNPTAADREIPARNPTHQRRLHHLGARHVAEMFLFSQLQWQTEPCALCASLCPSPSSPTWVICSAMMGTSSRDLLWHILGRSIKPGSTSPSQMPRCPKSVRQRAPWMGALSSSEFDLDIIFFFVTEGQLYQSIFKLKENERNSPI